MTEKEYQEQMSLCAEGCVGFVKNHSPEDLNSLLIKWTEQRLTAESSGSEGEPDVEKMVLYQMAVLGLDFARRIAVSEGVIVEKISMMVDHRGQPIGKDGTQPN